MKKYISLFNISFQQEFVYKISFLMWRLRNILQIVLVFFLWDTIFSNIQGELFGYDKKKILTYIFFLLIVRAVVLSSRAIDVAGEISRGDLNNYLIKPVNYIYYWFTRDVSTKVLNLFFALGETAVLYLLIKPPFFLQTNPIDILAFFVVVTLAAFIYFLITFILSLLPFWVPEAAWGVHFLFTLVITQFLSGSIFPIDVLPQNIQNILSFTPFPYLVYYPIQIYLGNIVGTGLIKCIGVSLFWTLFFWIVLKKIWSRGIRAYQAYGK